VLHTGSIVGQKTARSVHWNALQHRQKVQVDRTAVADCFPARGPPVSFS